MSQVANRACVICGFRFWREFAICNACAPYGAMDDAETAALEKELKENLETLAAYRSASTLGGYVAVRQLYRERLR